MTETIKLDLPAITFNAGSQASMDATRVAYDLHAGFLPAGYTLPDAVKITHLLTSLQSPWAIPANVYGRVTFVVDPGGRYCQEVKFVGGVEHGHPRFLKPLGYLNLAPGPVAFIDVRPCLLGPTWYRKGDRLLIVVETNMVSCDIQVFGGLGIESDFGDVAPDPGVIYAIPASHSAPSGAPACYRCQIPEIANIGAGHTHLQIHYGAREHGLSLAHASVGLQSGGGPHMVDTPVEFTFGGSPGLELPAWGEAWSDPIPFATSPGMNLLIDQSITGAWPVKMYTPQASWYSSTASYGSATMLGAPVRQLTDPASTYSDRVHGFDAVRAVTP